MGWDGSQFSSKKAAVEDRLRRMEKNGYEVLDSASTCQGLYAAVRHPNGEVFLMTSMVRRESGNWYYFKDMTEEMGPAMNDCPEKLFKYCEAPNENAVDFRESCRAVIAKRKQGIHTGDIVRIYGYEYEILGRRKNSYVMKRKGKLYRSAKKKEMTVVGKILPQYQEEGTVFGYEKC